MKPRRLIALPAAIAIMLATALPAQAECWPPPPGPDDVVPIRFAFIATVEDVRDPVDPTVDVANYRWHLELFVDRVYRGVVPSTLRLDGWDVGCSFIAPVGLRAGDRVFIAIDQLDLDANPLEGQLLMWRQSGEGWAFAEDALSYGSESRYWPTVAREARSIGEILALVDASPVPDTATAPAEQSDGSLLRVVILGLIFTVTAVLLAARPANRPPDAAAATVSNEAERPCADRSA